MQHIETLQKRYDTEQDKKKKRISKKKKHVDFSKWEGSRKRTLQQINWAIPKSVLEKMFFKNKK